MKTILFLGLALVAMAGVAAPIAGFREGGTTFGLWQGAGDGDAAADEVAFLAAGEVRREVGGVVEDGNQLL